LTVARYVDLKANAAGKAQVTAVIRCDCDLARSARCLSVAFLYLARDRESVERQDKSQDGECGRHVVGVVEGWFVGKQIVVPEGGIMVMEAVVMGEGNA
jgi:hypothetical protein